MSYAEDSKTEREQRIALERENAMYWLKVWGYVGLGVGVLIVVFLVVGPRYSVWNSEMSGRAMYAHAEYARKVQVAQAEGEKEAASLRAEAIKIVGQAATDFPQYRQQEFIGAFAEALKDGKVQQIIYVPTEANIPIVEMRRK
jgi:hypothetical protein